ncbi:hypothetical protein [Bdellovibrio reynosensis]|uniref:Uncharacterized protein n=1 Tax=Bdellovibrio reynosensis TaxID=2835041 RepID=A0ABY4C717_9BACT|nr:hypothetical protein [Bdellovibrio reynosensis]UOF00604.1 hypothetical protein MNR06_12940 [Bdellovibrio reynosensis]
MFPTMTKHAVITSALLATLALSACGKKKELVGPGAVKAQTKTETQDTTGNLGGGLPEPKGTELNPPPVNKVPPVVDSIPEVKDKYQLPEDYKANDASNVDRKGLSKRLTGGTTAEGLNYTSTSTDELLNFLRARNQKVNHDTRRLNLEAAASIVSAKMTVDKATRDTAVTLKIQEGSEVKVYNLAGYLAEDEYASALTTVISANGEIATGIRPVDGTIKCLDMDGGCETTFARLKIGQSPNSAIANIVFRNSKADVHFDLPGEYSNNPEYLVIRELVHSSIKRLNHDNTIKSVTMNSWEVVNGRSGVALTIKARNGELLGFAGPLLAPETGTRVNVKLSRIAKEDDDSLDLISLNSAKLNYANSVGEARMVANNGLGQVKILVKMRQRGSHAQDQFLVTFMRTIKPIVELSDENLK